jgi:hypothetical protein
MKTVVPKGLIPEVKAAEILGRTVASLKKWRVQGRGPAYFKIRRRAFYNREDLEKFMQSEIERVIPDQVRRSA